MRGIGHDRFDGNVVGEHFVVRVEDRSAFRVDRLLVNVFFAASSAYSSCLTICR